jgi:cell division protein FtsL
MILGEDIGLSNLAYQIQQRRRLEAEQEQRIQQAPKKKLQITVGEKILYLIFTMVVVIGSIVIVSNSAKIYSVNREISGLQASIHTQAKVNADLEHQVMELSTYERIWAKAHELGLMLNENNVKVVQD